MAELASYTIWVPTLLIVIFRLAGLFLTAPALSDPTIPPPVKTVLCIILSLAVTARISHPVPMPQDWTTLVLGIASEVAIGATIGYAATLLFAGIELAAEHIGQQLGITLASVFNPMFEETSNVLGTVLTQTTLCIFLVIGGHRVLLSGLMGTFSQVPLLGFSVNASLLDSIVGLMGASFILAIKISAPVMISMFLASLSMGFIQRTMPQLNILSAGFQIRILLGLLVMIASMAMLLPLIESMWSIIVRFITQMT